MKGAATAMGMKIETDQAKELDRLMEYCREGESFPLNLNVNDTSEQIINVQKLIYLKNSYQRTKNSVHAIEAYLFAWKCDFGIPIWVQSWLYTAFNKFNNSEGTLDLISLLGLQPKQKTGTPYRIMARQERDDELSFDVYILTDGYELSLDEAIAIVYEKYQTKEGFKEYHTTKLDIDTLNLGSIKTHYCNSKLIKNFKKKYINVFELLELIDREDRLSYFVDEYLDHVIKASERNDSIITNRKIERILKDLAKV